MIASTVDHLETSRPTLKVKRKVKSSHEPTSVPNAEPATSQIATTLEIWARNTACGLRSVIPPVRSPPVHVWCAKGIHGKRIRSPTGPARAGSARRHGPNAKRPALRRAVLRLVAGTRNRLVLAAGKQNGRPDARTADLVRQVRLVTGAGNRPNLLFDAPGLGAAASRQGPWGWAAVQSGRGAWLGLVLIFYVADEWRRGRRNPADRHPSQNASP